MWCEGGELVADWYLNRGLSFSYSDRVKEVLYLVAAQKITAGEAARFIELWGLAEAFPNETWRAWVDGVRQVAAAHPGAYVALAAADGAAFLDDRPARLTVAAVYPERKNRESAGRARTSVNSGDYGDIMGTDFPLAENTC